MKLKFNSDAWYNGELIAKAGEVKDIPEAHGYAARWIKRGAEEVKEEEVKEEVVSLIQEVDNLEVKEQNKKGKPHKGK